MSATTEILRFHHPNQQTSTARLALEQIEQRGKVRGDPRRMDRYERVAVAITAEAS